MNWKKKFLEKSRLYIIIDKKISKSRRIVKIAKAIKGLGSDIIQLRDLYVLGREQERRGILLAGLSSFALGMILVNLLKL